jgi:Sin3 binding region of histone deacetylase complex subunit SAP30
MFRLLVITAELTLKRVASPLQTQNFLPSDQTVKFRYLPSTPALYAIAYIDDQVDFNALPINALQKYKHLYNLSPMETTHPPKRLKTNHSRGKKRHHDDSDDDVSNSEDESPYRIDLGAWRPRVNKSELAKIARTHFSAQPPVRENDVIVQFLYAIKTQGT